MNKYSIVIPTHNRHNLMKKNIEYFSKFKDCRIYICDSTTEKYISELPENISYYHMSGKSFIQKMNEVLGMIKTDYVAVCADDDFILEGTTLKIINQLKKNNCVMGVGRYAGFDLPFEGFYKVFSKFPSVDSSFALLRVISYLSNYHMSLWAVYKTKTIKKSYEILNGSIFSNHNFIELTIAITCAIEGRVLFYEKLYAIREVNNKNSKNWAKQHKPLLFECKSNFKEIYIQIDNISSKSLNKFLYIVGTYCYLLFSLINYFKTKYTRKIIVKDNIKIEKELLSVKKIILEYQE